MCYTLFILWWNRFVKPTFKMRSISFLLLLESEKKFEHWTVHLWRWIWGHEFRSTSFSFGCQPTYNVIRLFVEFIVFSLLTNYYQMLKDLQFLKQNQGTYLKFIYSEKATNFYEISIAEFTYVVTVKSTVEISQNFVAFSDYINLSKSYV